MPNSSTIKAEFYQITTWREPVISLIELLGGKRDIPCPCNLCRLKRDEPLIGEVWFYNNDGSKTIGTGFIFESNYP